MTTAAEKITTTEYTGIDEAFEFFNRRLFGGALPPLLITYQRKSGACGYYSANRFERRDGSGQVPELALNPAIFKVHSDLEILQTLGHEMAHHWQHCLGNASRPGYHNYEWAAKMVEIGLMPSDTGRPGGKSVGQKMADYVLEGGLFERVAGELLESGFRFRFQSVEGPGLRPVKGQPKPEKEEGEEAKPKSRNKVKFCCPSCKAAAWGKPGLRLICGDCDEPMPEA